MKNYKYGKYLIDLSFLPNEGTLVDGVFVLDITSHFNEEEINLLTSLPKDKKQIEILIPTIACVDDAKYVTFYGGKFLSPYCNERTINIIADNTIMNDENNDDIYRCHMYISISNTNAAEFGIEVYTITEG